jgi:hypothetical protein
MIIISLLPIRDCANRFEKFGVDRIAGTPRARCRPRLGAIPGPEIPREQKAPDLALFAGSALDRHDHLILGA